MIGDDLVPFLHRDDPDWGFRQGTIVSFDLFVGTSTVRVGGGLLTDVPFLALAGQVYYEPGDAVLLVRYKSSWAIVGRYVTPGGTAAIGRYSEFTGAYQGTPALNWSPSTSYATKAALAISVPIWAQVATVTATLMAKARNSTAADDFLNARIQADGVTWAGAVSGTVLTTRWGAITVAAHFQMLVTPGGTLTLAGQLATTVATWTAHASNEAQVQATVTWNSNTG